MSRLNVSVLKIRDELEALERQIKFLMRELKCGPKDRRRPRLIVELKRAIEWSDRLDKLYRAAQQKVNKLEAIEFVPAKPEVYQPTLNELRQTKLPKGCYWREPSVVRRLRNRIELRWFRGKRQVIISLTKEAATFMVVYDPRQKKHQTGVLNSAGHFATLFYRLYGDRQPKNQTVSNSAVKCTI